MQSASHPQKIEYLLCVDVGGPFESFPLPADVTVVWNSLRHCSVDAWNTGAANSTGKVLILNSDDFRPEKDWDVHLQEAIPDLEADFVVETSSGSLADNLRLLALPIISRARYRRLGYAFYPEYSSMFADNEFADHARLDGAVVDARHLKFHHHHPHQGDGIVPWDETYAHQNSSAGWALGSELFNRRKAQGFPPWQP